MDVLSQEEIKALLEISKEDEPEDEKAPLPESERETEIWKPAEKITTTSGSNVISENEYELTKAGTKSSTLVDSRIDNRPIRMKIRSRMKQDVPFLELLLEYGNGALEQGSEIEVAIQEQNKLTGVFKGFYCDSQKQDGGLIIETESESVSVKAADIAVSVEGSFLITVAGGES